MPTTIITAWEIVKHSPLSNQMDTGKICEHIRRKERRFAREFLGKDYYDLLIADLIDYTGTAEYDSETTYSEGDNVLYFGTILQSKKNGNNTNPCDDDGTNWEIAPKFNSACYNALWLDYLREYLALYIAAEVIDYTTFPIGNKGVLEFVEDQSGMKTAGTHGFQGMKKKLLNDADEALENLKDYLRDYEGDCDYDEIEWADGCRTRHTRPNHSRKIHFRY